MKQLHSDNLQYIIDSLTEELQDAIENREACIMARDWNMVACWDEQIQNITDYCKSNASKFGL